MQIEDIVNNLLEYDPIILETLRQTSESGYTPEQGIGRLFLKELSWSIFRSYTDGLLVDEEPDLSAIRRHLVNLSITDIQYSLEDSTIRVKTSRPGVFIGVKGSDFEKTHILWKDLAKKMNIPYNGIKLVEDKWPIENVILQPVNYYYDF